MRFKKLNLLKRYATPIRIYQSNFYDDGGTNDFDEVVHSKVEDQPYVDVNEPIIPVTNFSDSTITGQDGTVTTYSEEWYTARTAKPGDVIGMPQKDGSFKKLVVVGAYDANGIADINIYYLKEDDTRAANL